MSFYGSSEPQNIQLVSTGTHHYSGRGVLIDNLVIEEVNGIQLGNNGFVTEISLNDYIGGELVDKDDSETLSYELSNLPADALIFVGDELIPINNGVVELTAEQLSTAKIQLPLSYTGKVSISIVAISTEESNDDQARSEAQIIDWVITDIPNIDNEDVKSEGDLVDAVQVYGAIGTDSEKVQWNGIDVPNPSEGLIVDVGAAGGTGEDIFKWVDQGVDTGTDTIKDFTVGEDLIDLIEIIGGDDDVINMEDLLSHITVSESGDDLTLSITDDAGNAHEIIVEGAVDSFGLEDANFSNQSEILTKLLNDQMFKLDDIT